MPEGNAARTVRFALVGVATGAAAAALTYLPIGQFPGLAIGQYCFGFKTGTGCDGFDAAFYVFPGAVFGLVFAMLLRRGRYLTATAAGLYAGAATFANGAAVFVCIGLVMKIDRLLPFANTDLAIAFSGFAAGAVGGGLLGAAVLVPKARRGLPLAAATGLGLLTPLVPRFEPIGHFVFYMLWQGGYAAALGMSLSPPVRARGRILVATTVLRWFQVWPAKFALCGLATGAVAAAACTQLPIGVVLPFQIAGYCLGVTMSGAGVMRGGACSGIEGAIYLFPGLVFGVVFGPLLHFRGRLSRSGVALYALAAAIANVIAVMLCVSALHPVDDLLPFDNVILDLAVAGGIAGAGGGAVLGIAFAALDGSTVDRRAIAVAAALGALTPLVVIFDEFGAYAFFMIWQGGYAAAIRIAAPNEVRV